MKNIRFLAAGIAFSLFLSPFSAWGYQNDEDHRVFSSGNREEKTIALTFDDGPHPIYTDEIREILDAYGIKATFFVIGVNAEQYPEPLMRLKEDGHLIGSHTYRHRHIGKQSEAQLYEDMAQNERVLARFGIIPTLFRPPEGVCEKKVIEAAGRYDYNIILWTVDTEDWRALPAERIAERALKAIHGGEIILMHDYVDHSNTPEALRMIIPKLLEEGYRFVTVEELIGL